MIGFVIAVLAISTFLFLYIGFGVAEGYELKELMTPWRNHNGK